MAGSPARIFFSYEDEDADLAAQLIDAVRELVPALEIPEMPGDADLGVIVVSLHYGRASDLASFRAAGIPHVQAQVHADVNLLDVPSLLDGEALTADTVPAAAEEIAALVGHSSPPRLSPSVRSAISRMRGAVPAASIVAELLELHPEYGNGAGGRLQVHVPTGPRKPATEWLAGVRALYGYGRVRELHGRTVIRGLALLEPSLNKDLLEHGFLQALESEMKPPLLDSLSGEGRRLWGAGEVPTHGDRPATTDELQREVFAQALAGMIVEERERVDGRSDSFLVHLHGPWGSGKSTLLGFLEARLKREDPPWVVVHFNAWQHERLGAPWWTLMSAIHRQGRRGAGLAGKLWLTGLKLWWRVKPAVPALLALAAVVAAVTIGISEGFFDQESVTTASDVAKNLGAIIALLVALAGVARGFTRSLAGGSAKGAEAFIRSTPDPMGVLVERFQRVVRRIGRPVIVFVDDMDRCQAEYLVEVLHGIQTLLVEAPVTYVVAADRRWLYDSYAKVYADFTSLGTEPGRPMGHLFLEKTFQLSAALPAIPPAVRDEYWRRLVDGQAPPPPPEQPERVEMAGRDLLGTFAAVEQARAQTPEQRAQHVAAASAQIAAPAVRREIEHRLLPFAPLLEPNPRAMKRLINAYRIELQRLLAEGRRVGAGSVTPEQLALWTIVSLRWPLLADELAREPGLATDPTLSETMQGLAASPAVRAVLDGEGVNGKLTEQAIRALVGLGPRRTAEPSVA